MQLLLRGQALCNHRSELGVHRQRSRQYQPAVNYPALERQSFLLREFVRAPALRLQRLRYLQHLQRQPQSQEYPAILRQAKFHHYFHS